MWSQDFSEHNPSLFASLTVMMTLIERKSETWGKRPRLDHIRGDTLSWTILDEADADDNCHYNDNGDEDKKNILPRCSGPPFFTIEFNIWDANSFVIVDDKPPPSNLPVPSHDFLFLSWSSIQFIRFQIEQIMQNAFLVSGNTGVFQISGTLGVTHFKSGPWLFIWSIGSKSLNSR